MKKDKTAGSIRRIWLKDFKTSQNEFESNEWLFETSCDVISISIENLNLEYSSECQYDHLSLLARSGTEKFCGNITSAFRVIQGPLFKIKVYFDNDRDRDNGPGKFTLAWQCGPGIGLLKISNTDKQ